MSSRYTSVRQQLFLRKQIPISIYIETVFNIEFCNRQGFLTINNIYFLDICKTRFIYFFLCSELLKRKTNQYEIHVLVMWLKRLNYQYTPFIVRRCSIQKIMTECQSISCPKFHIHKQKFPTVFELLYAIQNSIKTREEFPEGFFIRVVCV